MINTKSRLMVMAALAVLALRAAPALADSQSGDTTSPPAAPDSRVRLTWPDLTLDGGEWTWDWNGRGHHRSNLALGWWGGGSLTIYYVPLSDRLGPLSSDRGLDDFDDVLLLYGPRAYFEVNRHLRIGLFFDTGFEGVEGRVDNEHREANLNLTRLGVSLQALSPLEDFLDQLPGDLPELPGQSALSVGLGLDLGLGYLNISVSGDDISLHHNFTEPFVFFTPSALVSAAVNSNLRAELSLGYAFVTMNDFSIEYYLGEEEWIDGSDFSGPMVGVQLLFGFDDYRDLISPPPGS